MISNSGHDENGAYSGGRSGDQTGTEWQIQPWYSRPWTFVLRHPSADVRKQIAELATEAAQNDKIGYDQSQRLTFWQCLAESGYHPANIKTPCEADCSAGVAAIVKATGYLLGIPALQKISKSMYTGNERKVLEGAGFTVLSASKYLVSDRYLLEGDILLCENHHTAINLDNGSAVNLDWHWVYSAGKWYYQDSDGNNTYGWKLIKETQSEFKHWYYFDEKGASVTNWKEIGGKWYYFEPSGDLCGALYRSDENGAQSVWYIN